MNNNFNFKSFFGEDDYEEIESDMVLEDISKSNIKKIRTNSDEINNEEKVSKFSESSVK